MPEIPGGNLSFFVLENLGLENGKDLLSRDESLVPVGINYRLQIAGSHHEDRSWRWYLRGGDELW